MIQQVLYDTITGQIKGILNIHSNVCASLKTKDNDSILEFNGDISINPMNDRIINDQIVPKPLVSLSALKNTILADGTDETEISVSISDCLEDETVDSITLSIADQSFEVPLTNNIGGVNFSSKVPGKYIIDVPGPRFRKNTVEVIINEAQ